MRIVERFARIAAAHFAISATSASSAISTSVVLSVRSRA
jgi:hypothetical protein